MNAGFAKDQGLYNSAYEHDACGIGFVAHIKGYQSHDIIRRGLEVLERMTHRGAESADNKTGDGAGIMLQLPHSFFQAEVPALPDPGRYGMGTVFLPRDPDEAAADQQAADGGQPKAFGAGPYEEPVP